MSDKGYDAPKPDKPELRYSEFTPPSLRQAAGFAINSFAALYAPHNMQRKLGVELSDDQLRMASYLREIYHQAAATLPSVQLNAVRSGYGAITSDVMEVIPYNLKKPALSDEDPITIGGDSIKQDPTGVSILRERIESMRTKARESSTLNSFAKVEHVQALYTAIDELVKHLPDTNPEPSEDADLREIIWARFNNSNPRESARTEERNKIYDETGLVADEKGDIVPYDQLQLVGAELAFDQYKRAVDFYLTKWGTKS